MTDYESQRGILSPDDRTYLRGDTEYAQPASERNTRRRIRERVRAGISDFALLFQYLERRDRIQIMNQFAERHDEIQAELRGEEPIEGPPEQAFDILYNPEIVGFGIYTGGLRHMQAFAFLLLIDDVIEEFGLPGHRFDDLAAELVEMGLKDALGKKGIVADIDVDIDITEENVAPEKLRERFEDGYETISDQEIEWLIHTRDIDWDEYIDYLKATRHAED